jgi:hypothetical protein
MRLEVRGSDAGLGEEEFVEKGRRHQKDDGGKIRDGRELAGDCPEGEDDRDDETRDADPEPGVRVGLGGVPRQTALTEADMLGGFGRFGGHQFLRRQLVDQWRCWRRRGRVGELHLSRLAALRADATVHLAWGRPSLSVPLATFSRSLQRRQNVTMIEKVYSFRNVCEPDAWITPISKQSE